MKLSIDLFERAFQLAYFIFPNRSAAIDIVASAMGRLGSQCRREQRRLYWRDKRPPNAIRRMTRTDLDVLQWLILYESESHEKEQELTRRPSLNDLAIRYVKHLVRVTTAMSSLYVAVGLNRLLYDYTTSETQRVYESVTRRRLGADRYRRVKSALLNSLQQRFGELLTTASTQRGEVRFEPLEDQSSWMPLVNECLRFFTPWSTNGVCSRLSIVDHSDRKCLFGNMGAEWDYDLTELNCCHILIEPACCRRILSALKFDPPETRLALPKFGIDGGAGGGPNGWRVPGLSLEERMQIAKCLGATEQRRQNIHARSITIVVDGIKHAELDLGRARQLRSELEQGAKLIEILAQDEAGELLLGSHFIDYENGSFTFSRGTLSFNNGKLELLVCPTAGSSETGMVFVLNYEPKPVSIGIGANTPASLPVDRQLTQEGAWLDRTN